MKEIQIIKQDTRNLYGKGVFVLPDYHTINRGYAVTDTDTIRKHMSQVQKQAQVTAGDTSTRNNTEAQVDIQV